MFRQYYNFIYILFIFEIFFKNDQIFAENCIKSGEIRIRKNFQNAGDIWQLCTNTTNNILAWAIICGQEYNQDTVSNIICKSQGYFNNKNSGSLANLDKSDSSSYKINNINCSSSNNNNNSRLLDCEYSVITSSCQYLYSLGCKNCRTGYCSAPGFCNTTTGKCECTGKCINKGYCSIGKCICSSVYTGEYCEICKCKNGGVCLDNDTCRCYDSSYYGDNCEYKECIDACTNNTICDTAIGQCKCPKGLTGPNCNDIITSETQNETGQKASQIDGRIILSLLIATPISLLICYISCLCILIGLIFGKNISKRIYKIKTKETKHGSHFLDFDNENSIPSIQLGALYGHQQNQNQNSITSNEIPHIIDTKFKSQNFGRKFEPQIIGRKLESQNFGRKIEESMKYEDMVNPHSFEYTMSIENVYSYIDLPYDDTMKNNNNNNNNNNDKNNINGDVELYSTKSPIYEYINEAVTNTNRISIIYEQI